MERQSCLCIDTCQLFSIAGKPPLKKFTYYLETASKLDQMEVEEPEQHLKKLLTKLATTYREMATERASKLDLQSTSPPFDLDSRD